MRYSRLNDSHHRARAVKRGQEAETGSNPGTPVVSGADEARETRPATPGGTTRGQWNNESKNAMAVPTDSGNA